MITLIYYDNQHTRHRPVFLKTLHTTKYCNYRVSGRYIPQEL